MKKILALVIAALMVTTLFAFPAFAEETDEPGAGSAPQEGGRACDI